jgi:4-amino-4-deoxy-L-arabinose transferase-like glycosyltransferase
MSINSKDTILAFCFVYTLYFALKYVDNFKNEEKRSRYTYLVALVVGLGSGTRGAFIITLLPICVFVIYKIYYSTWKNESKTKFYADVLKIVFWHTY